MFICDSNCIRHKFAIARCESSIANTRLSKCHNLNIMDFIIDLGIRRQSFNTRCTSDNMLDNSSKINTRCTSDSMLDNSSKI